MADYLVYWKTYWRQWEKWGEEAVDAQWYTKNRRLYDRVKPHRDTLWVVISGGASYRKEWRLRQRIDIVGKRILPHPDPVYGRYHLRGDPNSLQNFDPARQPNLESTLRQLEFQSETPITALGRGIGHSIQSYRRLTRSDVQKLERFLRMPPTPEPPRMKSTQQLDQQLAERGYVRTTQASLRRIMRLHNKLSNACYNWLKRSGYRVVRERKQIDIQFERAGTTYCAELKIIQRAGSTQAIREAVGQLLEYNYYRGRRPADYWVVLLDREPSEHDIEYMRVLKAKLRMPLSLGWQSKEAFSFAEGLSLSPS